MRNSADKHSWRDVIISPGRRAIESCNDMKMFCLCDVLLQWCCTIFNYVHNMIKSQQVLSKLCNQLQSTNHWPPPPKQNFIQKQCLMDRKPGPGSEVISMITNFLSSDKSSETAWSFQITWYNKTNNINHSPSAPNYLSPLPLCLLACNTGY